MSRAAYFDLQPKAATISETFTYDGEDLDAMDLAENYHAWILDGFREAIGANVVEVGAGTGSFSRMIARHPTTERLFLLEPAAAISDQLRRTADSEIGKETFVETGFVSDSSAQIAAFDPDTITYVNVLEHVEHDADELNRVFDLLKPGGTLCVFVPALPFLYSEFDRSIDHYRRYTKRGLRAECESAGFEVTECRYFDLLGILPWLIKFKLLGSTTLNPGAVAIYDRFVVPVMRRLEAWVTPPVGKNLLLVARKPVAPRGRD